MRRQRESKEKEKEKEKGIQVNKHKLLSYTYCRGWDQKKVFPACEV